MCKHIVPHNAQDFYFGISSLSLPIKMLLNSDQFVVCYKYTIVIPLEKVPLVFSIFDEFKQNVSFFRWISQELSVKKGESVSDLALEDVLH